MDDEQIRARIEELEEEERRLRRDERDAAEREARDRLAADVERLSAVRVELDRLWDYLRQRRALRDAGADPAGAVMRDADTVEHYRG
jgi:hypothetical protein